MPTKTFVFDFDDTITTGDAKFNGKKILYKGVRPRSWFTEENVKNDIVCLEKSEILLFVLLKMIVELQLQPSRIKQ